MISSRSVSLFATTLAVACVGVFTSAALAGADLQSDFAAQVQRSNLGKTTLGLYVVDLDANRELVAINADDPFLPASNMKLVTTAASLSTLGPDFVFRTELQLAANTADGAVIVVHGDGDPGFCDPKLLAANGLDVEKILDAWVAAVQKVGVKTIAQLVIDDRVFDYQRVHPAWPANQLTSWYCAQVSGLAFFDNCLDVTAQPRAAGTAPAVNVTPDAPFLQITNKATSGGGDKLVINRPAQSNHITITGKLKAPTAEPISVTLDDPAAFFGQVFADRLTRAGIAVTQIVRPGPSQQLPEGKTLHVIRTTLPLVLARCNKDSQNLFAESLLKRIGFATTGRPGSWINGPDAVSDFLVKKAGVPLNVVAVSDGSGMSRENRVTPRAMVRVLTAMHCNATLGPIYKASLSIAGRDGTLAERISGADGLVGTVHAKTGYLNGVSCLSGYLVTPAPGNKTRTLAFSLLFNNVADVNAVKALQDQLVRLIDQHAAGLVSAAATP